MTIRTEEDSLSRARSHKYDYFDKQDKSSTSEDFNRFIFMSPGTKDKFYDWRYDFSTSDIPYTVFFIDQEKFVNRPDAIAYNVYGNAKYWWIIAMANKIKDPFFEFHKGRELIIPNIDHFKKKIGL